MKQTLLILALIVIGFESNATAQMKTGDESVDRALQIQACVRQFFAGVGCDEVVLYTSGRKEEESVPTAESIKESYKSPHLVVIKSVDLRNGTVVVLAKTDSGGKSEKVHTFTLRAMENKVWKVKAWHVSDESK